MTSARRNVISDRLITRIYTIVKKNLYVYYFPLASHNISRSIWPSLMHTSLNSTLGHPPHSQIWSFTPLLGYTLKPLTRTIGHSLIDHSLTPIHSHSLSLARLITHHSHLHSHLVTHSFFIFHYKFMRFVGTNMTSDRLILGWYILLLNNHALVFYFLLTPFWSFTHFLYFIMSSFWSTCKKHCGLGYFGLQGWGILLPPYSHQF